jgi:hypothetical protein
MNRMRFSYLKWTPIAAGLAIAVLLSMPSSKATNQPAAASADLRNEERVIAKYFDDLVAYDKQVAELGKRARLVSSDLEAIQNRSDDLKRRLAEVQDAVGEAVKKLKAANEWTDLDSSIATRITDAKAKSFFQESSFKQLLEEGSSNLGSRKEEIAAPLQSLRKKLTGRSANGADFLIVRAGYTTPVVTPVMIKSARCMLAGIRFGVSGFVHGADGVKQRAQDGMDCYCGGSASACAAI